MIILDNISKRYPHRNQQGYFDALQPMSLHIRPGEIFGLMGYSGAGKSTLLRLMNLLERPDTGSVTVDQQEISRFSKKELRIARRHIGMIFQQFNLLSNRTVAQNVAFALEVAGTSKAAIAQRVAECLEVVGLSDRAAHYPAQLSGGQKQRVGIARALAGQPKVILADEPTSALDPATTRSILKCLSDINQRFGTTIVIVTHEMSVIRRLCDRVALLHQGQLIETIAIENNTIRAESAIGRKLVQEV